MEVAQTIRLGAILFFAGAALAACSDSAEAPAPLVATELMGDWQSLEDPGYVLKFNVESYREFYDTEEVSRDKWEPVKSCADSQLNDKTGLSYGGFQIWTKETDDRICYAISDWSEDKVSFTYAGTTSRYTRID